MNSQATECVHNVVYAGVINLIRGFGILGAVDAWTCTLCNELWCDEKRIAHQELPPEVGLPPRTKGKDWAVIFCDNGDKNDWNLIQIAKGDTFEHSCSVFSGCRLKVSADWKPECSSRHDRWHRLIMVRPALNKSIYV
jgi:hypothetical protein